MAPESLGPREPRPTTEAEAWEPSTPGYQDAWRAAGATPYLAALLILPDWALTTAVIAGLTRLLNRP